MRDTDDEMRAKGEALVRHLEEYARTHPEFVEELHAAEADIEAGHYSVFPDPDPQTE